VPSTKCSTAWRRSAGSDARRSLAAQERERRRVSRALHDEVGQTLTAIVLRLGRLQSAAPPALRPELAKAREDARGSLEDVRRIAQRLRLEALEDLGLASALETLCDRVSERGNLRVLTRLDADLSDLTPDLELVTYRVAQEALTNALRHADASEALVDLRRERGGRTRARR
jgi:two-component system, NarL family, sensor histidine kinase UhpB